MLDVGLIGVLASMGIVGLSVYQHSWPGIRWGLMFMGVACVVALA